MWELLELGGGIAIVMLPLFILAVPSVVLLGLVLVPLAAVALAAGAVGALLVLPALAVRRAYRRRISMRPARSRVSYAG